MNFIGDYSTGDLASLAAAGDEMKRTIDALPDPILVAHHGDCDGITGGALMAHVLTSSGRRVKFASCAEFRAADLVTFRSAFAGCASGIFVEAQGMTPEYAELDPHFVNIDHHPHPADTPIRRMLNPRNFGVEPNPAIGFFIYELYRDRLPANAAWLAAIASIMDYCPLPAKSLIDACAGHLRELDLIRDTFLASQYVPECAARMAEFLSAIPSPDAFVSSEPFASRREKYRMLFDEGIRGASVSEKLVFTELERGEIRIASPLANRLQDLHPSKCVVVIENSGDTSRLSVRLRSGTKPIGATLAEIAARVGAGDGTGHEKAGSARIPSRVKKEFLKLLEEEIG